MLKKIISGFLALIMILALMSGCAKGSEPAVDNGDGVQTEESTASAESTTPATDPQISVKVPDRWEQIDGAALAQYMKGSASFIVTCDTVPDGISGSEDFVDFAKSQFKDAFPDAEFSEGKKITVNGMDGQELNFTASASGMEMKYRIVYILQGSQAYTLTCGDVSEDFDNVAGEFQSMIDSFKIQ
jgi:predicted Zn-dependent protease